MTEKQWNEQYAFNIFKDYYHAFPDGDIIHDNSPDFTITNTTGIIGVDVFDVYQDSDLDRGSILKKEQSVQNKVETILLDILVKKTGKNFSLGVTINKKHSIGNNNIDRIVWSCVPHCWEFLMNNSQGIFRINKYPEQFSFPLPAEIDSIYIHILSSEIPSYNSQSQGGVVPNLEYRHIEPKLLKHEKAIDGYKPCNQYWLLIREGNYHAGSFSSINIPIPIESRFEKVFIIRTRHREVITLK